MLRDTFYKIADYQEISDDTVVCTVAFQLQHEIFAAHFPQQPIVPGACLLQIATELIAEKYPTYQFCTAKSIKFSQLIEPAATPLVCFQMVQKSVAAGQFAVHIFYQDTTFVKMNLQFQS